MSALRARALAGKCARFVPRLFGEGRLCSRPAAAFAPAEAAERDSPFRRLRVVGGNCPRRHGRRLSRPPDQTGARSRHQTDAARHAGVGGGCAAVPRGGRGGGFAPASGDRGHSRSRRSGGPAVLLDGPHRGPGSRDGDAAGTTSGAAGRRVGGTSRALSSTLTNRACSTATSSRRT